MLPFRLKHRINLGKRRSANLIASRTALRTLPFPQNYTRHLLTRHEHRPHLPFLHPGITGRPAPSVSRGPIRAQLARLWTAEGKKYLKEQTRLSIKYTLIGWSALGLLGLFLYGTESLFIERDSPSPPNWSFLTRHYWRVAKHMEKPDETCGDGRFSLVGKYLLVVLRRLEDANIDGAGLRSDIAKDHEDGTYDSAFDISAKPEAWRRGYYQVLMDLAAVAATGEGWVMDRTRKIAFPAAMVISPLNPVKKAAIQNAPLPPLEEDCDPLFPTPQSIYEKLLATSGFDSRQRTDAALAYANWLEYKGLEAAAEDSYRRALEIAASGMPAEARDSIDFKTGKIKEEAQYISSNVLGATSAMAAFYGRSGNVSASLPTFLSILRVRRKARAGVPNNAPSFRSEPGEETILGWFRAKLNAFNYPTPPSDGNEFPPVNDCEEAILTAHIGEILFASSLPRSASITKSTFLGFKQTPEMNSRALLSQDSGLAWTRDAVELAERAVQLDSGVKSEERKRCFECLEFASTNWAKMTASVLKEEQDLKASNKDSNLTSWIWSSAPTKDEDGERAEKEHIEQRLRSIGELINSEKKKQPQKRLLETIMGR